MSALQDLRSCDSLSNSPGFNSTVLAAITYFLLHGYQGGVSLTGEQILNGREYERVFQNRDALLLCYNMTQFCIKIMEGQWDHESISMFQIPSLEVTDLFVSQMTLVLFQSHLEARKIYFQGKHHSSVTTMLCQKREHKFWSPLQAEEPLPTPYLLLKRCVFDFLKHTKHTTASLHISTAFSSRLLPSPSFPTYLSHL